MFRIRSVVTLTALAVFASACASSGSGAGGGALPVPGQAAGQQSSTGTDDSTTDSASDDSSGTTDGGDAATSTDAPATTDGDTGPTTSIDASTTTPDSTTTTTPDSTTTTTTTTPDSTTTTTTTVPGLDVYDPLCVVEVESGDSIGLIADEFDDPTVNIPTIIAENDLDGDTIYPGQLLDVCVDNGLDDVTGSERAPNQALASAARQEAVMAQQEKLNELFDGLGMRELLVDGISGPVTRQRLCAARLALGLPVTRDDMEAGSEEEELLMATEQLRQPFTTALLSERWILIDRTCQVMFTGEADNGITNVFSTSTGEAGYETRDQDRTRAYRFDPALDNDGWHNSTTYPVPEDNPLNGNMYKPLYFDGGQAIHGSNNVPTTPQSKGCARLRVADMETLIAWLGLDGVTSATYSDRLINVTVNVQGAYDVPDDELPTDA